MKLSELFEAAIKELVKLNCAFAVGGGLAADLYRTQSRVTNDADFLFLTEGLEVETGRGLLENLDLSVGEVKLHQLVRSPQMNKKSSETYILVGRKTRDEPGVDLLLPPFPWFSNALERAKSNLIDFGFGAVPTLTPEDVILAKLFANRPKDVDDIISIFESGKSLDIAYLAAEMDRLKFTLPKEAVKNAPMSLQRFVKRAVQKRKSFP